MKRDIKVVEDINGYEAIYIDGFLKNEGNPPKRRGMKGFYGLHALQMLMV